LKWRWACLLDVEFAPEIIPGKSRETGARKLAVNLGNNLLRRASHQSNVLEKREK